MEQKWCAHCAKCIPAPNTANLHMYAKYWRDNKCYYCNNDLHQTPKQKTVNVSMSQERERKKDSAPKKEFKLIHGDRNGCQTKEGEFATEVEARKAAEDWFRKYCYLSEQVEHFVDAMDIDPKINVAKLTKRLHSVEKNEEDQVLEIEEYCDNYNNDSRDAIILTGPNGLEAYYIADLCFDVKRGFYFNVWSNA